MREDNGFYLHTPKHLPKADNYVVAVTIAPGFGDGESHACSLAHEGQLGQFAKILLAEFGRMLKRSFDGFFRKSPGFGPINVNSDACLDTQNRRSLDFGRDWGGAAHMSRKRRKFGCLV